MTLLKANSQDLFFFRCCFRYFQCEPKYGLFAPAHKIKKIADGHSPVTVDTPKAGESPAPLVTAEENVVPVSAFHVICSSEGRTRNCRVKLCVRYHYGSFRVVVKDECSFENGREEEMAIRSLSSC